MKDYGRWIVQLHGGCQLASPAAIPYQTATMRLTALRAVQGDVLAGLAAARASRSAGRVLVRTMYTERTVLQKSLHRPLPRFVASQQQRGSLTTSSMVNAQVEQDNAEPEMGEGDSSSSEIAAQKEHPPITSEYQSLKPYITYDTWKALTNRPFNFKEMSEVQNRVLNLLPALADPFLGEMPDKQGGRDLLVKARTGTGKTIAFLVPAVERRLRAIFHAERGRFTEPWTEMLKEKRPDLDFPSLDKHGRQKVRRQFCYNTAGALIISPTRELATQIATEAKKLCTYHDDFGVQLLVGGASRSMQLRDWNRSRPDIVVATPGRLLDMLREDSLVREPLSAVQTVIYDEADTLLDMGFRDDIEEILTFLPKAEKRSTMLFSATISRDIRQIARKSLLPDHRFIDCVPPGEENVHQHVPQYATVSDNANQQVAHLARLIALDQLRNPGKSKVIVFMPTKFTTQFFAELFSKHSDLLDALPAGSHTGVYELHSGLDPKRRSRVSENFRNDKRGASVLFTSDVSARGVDYPGTTQVVQIGIPSSTDIYIHRVGRTGRAGKQGRADLIVQSFESTWVKDELKQLPVQSTDVELLKKEVEDLGASYDNDPSGITPADAQESKGSRSRSSMDRGNRRTMVWSDVASRLEELDAVVKRSTEMSSKDLTTSSFMSLLGYYSSRSKDLKTPIKSIVEALQQWASDIGNLERPPYVSEAFLSRLGTGYLERDQRRSQGRHQGGRYQGGSRFGGNFDRESSNRGRSRGGDRDAYSRGRGRFDNFDGGSRRGSYGRDRESASSDRF